MTPEDKVHFDKITSKWPLVRRFDDIWIYSKTPRCVLVCEGEPRVEYSYGYYVSWPKMVEIFVYDDWEGDDENGRLVMKIDPGYDTPYHYMWRRYYRDTLARHDQRIGSDEEAISTTARIHAENYLWTYFYEWFPAKQVRMAKNLYYQQMLAWSKRLDYPSVFKSDLYKIDMERLADYEPDKFVWVLYKAGTNLCFTKEEASNWVNYRMANCDDPQYFVCWQGIVERVDHDYAIAWSSTHLPSNKEFYK